MELRLQKFVTSMETLSDIRNLDVANPVMVVLRHPTNGSPFTAIASEVEPYYLGIPINTTWVVLDSDNAYYLKCLKFKSWQSSPESAALGFKGTWEPIDKYNEIFSDVQYYGGVERKGPTGDRGPAGAAGVDGAKGPPGDLPVVDYDYILSRVLNP